MNIRMLLARTLLAGSWAAILSTRCWAEDIGASGISRAEGCSVLANLQAALRTSDIAALATLVEFPLNVYHTHQASYIRDVEALQKGYPSIFTASVRDAVLNQDCATIFGNWRGIMIGRGQVWITGICFGPKPSPCDKVRVRITTINVDAPHD
jgi:hypothetical protein